MDTATRATSTRQRTRPLTSESTATSTPLQDPSSRAAGRPRNHRSSTSATLRPNLRRDSGMSTRLETASEASGTGTATGSEGSAEWEGGKRTASDIGGRRRKKDEPMSPVSVVLYVICFYIIWQILTRSDESEILSHLPSSSSVHSSSSAHHPSLPYPMSYHLPQIPNPLPLPSTIASGSENHSTLRTIASVLIYPFYLAVTLLAIPLPLLANGAWLLFTVLSTLLYPITSTARLLGRTFILTPYGLVRSVLAVFYPVYVFVAGVIGVGCVMGLGAGWVGKLGMEWIFSPSSGSSSSSSSKQRVRVKKDKVGGPRSRSSKSKAASSSVRGRSTHPPAAAVAAEHEQMAQAQAHRVRVRPRHSPSSGEEREHLYTPQAPVREMMEYPPTTPVAPWDDSVHNPYDDARLYPRDRIGGKSARRRVGLERHWEED